MKITLVFPPQFDPSMPHLALPCLTAVLRRAGHWVIQRDINLELYDEILKESTICKSLGTIQQLRLEILERGCSPQMLETALMTGPVVARLVESAKTALRNPEDFCNYERYSGSLKIIDQAMLIYSLAYYPTRLSLYGFVMEKPPYSTPYILESTHDRLRNPFITLFDEFSLPSLLDEKPDLVGISISYEEQLVPGLTLARLIKTQLPETHIVIGGNILTRHKDSLVSKPSLFTFVDSVIVYEGETAMLDLAQRIEKGDDLFGVANLYFKRDGVIHPPARLHVEDIQALPTPDYAGLPVDRYYSPVPVLPAYMSRGCYWRNCAFCTSPNGQDKTFRTRSAQRVAEDMIELKQKWQAACFSFVDEAIPPRHLGELADQLLSSGLPDFSWISWARFDRGFTPQVLARLKRSGCAALLFGLESANERVLRAMRKGIRVQTTRDILTASSEVGIINHTGILIGFPTENPQESLETVRFVLDNNELIQSIGLSLFNLDSDSHVMVNPDQYDIRPILHPDEDLASAYDYVAGGVAREEKRLLYNEITKLLELVFPYHILSIHRFLYPLLGDAPDINGCTVDQGLDKYARINQHNLRVESAYQYLAELDFQIQKGEKYHGN